MSASTGNSSHERKSDVFEPASDLTGGRLLLLLGLGAGIVAVGQIFRFSLGMPGHHGLEAMALLAVARLSTNYRWGATIAAISAAATAAAIGAGHGGLVPVLYILPGLAIDLGVMLVPAWRQSLLWLPAFAAVGHASKPVVKWIATQGTSAHLGSMTNGLPYPVTTHLIFGFTGALAATLVWRSWQKSSR
jgi:hypothetical protein